jgi:hypothetical protein
MAADAITPSANANISATTRDFWLRTVVDQVFLKMPLYARLLMADKVSWKGGQHITAPVDTAEWDDLMQDYTAGEGMTSGRAATLTKPWFNWKMAQMPVSYNVDEYLQNGGASDIKVIDFSEYLTKKSHKATRIGLYKRMYSSTSTDATKPIQSVYQALNHDATYGHVSRATTVTNKWWQGASIAETFADQDTSRTISIHMFRQAFSAADMRAETAGNYLCVVGPDNYLNLKSQVDGSVHIVNPPGPLVKYGFQSFMLDGVEVVRDPYLRATGLTAETALGTGPEKWFFIFNINDWELRLHPERSIRMTPFKWQGDYANGPDEWLARIMIAGNLVCWRPQGSIWLSDVTG